MSTLPSAGTAEVLKGKGKRIQSVKEKMRTRTYQKRRRV